MLIRVWVQGKVISRVEYVPISVLAGRTALADSIEAKHVMSDFETRTKEIQEQSHLEKHYQSFCMPLWQGYASSFLGGGKAVRLLNRLLGKHWIRRVYGEAALLRMRNYIECESHREAIVTILKRLTEE